MFEDYTGEPETHTSSQFSTFTGIDQRKGAHFQRNPDPLIGYTGHFIDESFHEEHDLEKPLTKLMIRGYTGHRPFLKNLCGEPMIPSEDKQQSQLEFMQRSMAGYSEAEEDKGPIEGQNFNFRAFAKHMDIIERYAHSVQALNDRGQSQEMLLRIVQAKMSERVNSYAIQMIRTRKLFEAFDINGDGVLDEGEFRICLEKLNIQFDEMQSLALFAYFDHNNDGFVEWEDFAQHAMVQNPRGGTAVLPKMIISGTKQVDGIGNSSRTSPKKSSTHLRAGLNAINHHD